MKISVLEKISVALSVLAAALPFQTAWADSAANARANRQEQDRIAHCLQVYGNMNCMPEGGYVSPQQRRLETEMQRGREAEERLRQRRWQNSGTADGQGGTMRRENHADGGYTLYHYTDSSQRVLETVMPYDENGKVHGVVKGYYPNGKLKYTLPHRHGVYFGEAREYDENGRLRLVKRYDDKGERIYLREYP